MTFLYFEFGYCVCKNLFKFVTFCVLMYSCNHFLFILFRFVWLWILTKLITNLISKRVECMLLSSYRLRRIFIIWWQFWRSRLSQQASLAIWLNWFTHTPARELRSSLRRPNQLNVPRVGTAFGSRAFRPCAPAVWNGPNGLPLEITDTALSLETFKSGLKTYLFN